MRWAAGRWHALRATVRLVRQMPVSQLALRVVLLGTGAVALAVAPGGRFIVPGLITVLAVPGLLEALRRPAGAGPGVVLGAAALGWVLRYGVSTPPAALTALLAAVLYLHHLTACLCAAVPPAAQLEPGLLLGWARHASLALGLAGLVAVGVMVLDRVPASVPLELSALAAAVLLVALPVVLARGD